MVSRPCGEQACPALGCEAAPNLTLPIELIHRIALTGGRFAAQREQARSLQGIVGVGVLLPRCWIFEAGFLEIFFPSRLRPSVNFFEKASWIIHITPSPRQSAVIAGSLD